MEGTGIDFRKSDEVLLAAEISKQLNVKDGKLHLGKTLIPITLPGKPGKNGKTPKKGVDYFDGKDGKTPKKGVDYRDGIDGKTPVKGIDYDDGEPGYTPVKGVDYRDGTDGKTPKHEWDDTRLRFKKPDGDWGLWHDLQGKPGENIKGDKGDIPGHEWMGTLLRIQNPDGTWDKWVDLKGKTGRGKPGKNAKSPVKGVDYFDGEPGPAAELPEALDMVVLIDADMVMENGEIKLKKRFGKIRIYPKG